MPEITLQQGPLAYRESGSGEPLVFLHGYLMGARLWEPVVERLEDEFRCIALDLPFGAHAKPLRPDADLSVRGVARLVADAIGALGLERATLVGNDSGGAVAQVVAAEHPERVDRLVLTPCDAFDNFPPKLFRPLIPLSAIPGALTVFFMALRMRAPRNLPFAYGWLTKRPLRHDLIDEWVRAFYASRGVRRDVRKLTRGLDTNVILDADAKLAGFERPALIAFAADDKLFPFEHAERLGRVIPDARVERIEDSRTWVMFDQPERTAQLIRDFMRATAVRSDEQVPAQATA